MKKIPFYLALIAIVSGCASEEQGGISEVPNPTPQMAQKSATSETTLQRGHAVYMMQCGQCHAYPLPAQLEAAEFVTTVPKMEKHAGLTSEQGHDVLAYILAVKKM